MFAILEYFPAISVLLSKVLDEIGVNTHMVLKRRRTFIQKEQLITLYMRFLGHLDVSVYHFGSQSEGTTTLGIHSDVDQLLCTNTCNVIQDLSEWKEGKVNMLMIQDKTTAPGYCKLQPLSPDTHRPITVNIPDGYLYYVDENGTMLLASDRVYNNVGNKFVIRGPSNFEGNRHGPATTKEEDQFDETDTVIAMKCKTWRPATRPHNVKYEQNRWSTCASSCLIEQAGCFLVPVGHKESDNKHLEWRISPSLTERALMFSMNMTQIKCYVVLKMIVKTFLAPCVPECISSYHCKTALFWCVENTNNSNAFWVDENLLTCILICLYQLLKWIECNFCPQFFIPEENLFAGKLDFGKKCQLNKILDKILSSNGRWLLAIDIDDLGKRLVLKCNISLRPIETYKNTSEFVSSLCLAYNQLRYIGLILKYALEMKTCLSDNTATRLCQVYEIMIKIFSYAERQTGPNESIIQILASMCTTIASLMSSMSIGMGKGIPRVALQWFVCGLNSDISSSRLKLASALYCIGDFHNVEKVLLDTIQRFDHDYVMNVCGCFAVRKPVFTIYFGIKTYNDERYSTYVSYCLRFMRTELHCVPPALQYEMFRSSPRDKHLRGKEYGWMDWAVVDSLPYAYYLLYMTYRQIGKRQERKQAVIMFINSINYGINLKHKETALNLLGKCADLENDVYGAFLFYKESLNFRRKNNAARWHIGCLVFNLLQNKQRRAKPDFLLRYPFTA